jgi:uncharacterized RDD family membrane protein YckC
MNCPHCGDVCRCPLEPLPPALLQWTPDREAGTALAAASLSEEMNPEAAVVPRVEAEHLKSAEDASQASDLPASGASPQEAAPAWRDELSARLDRYRARRKVRPPRYPSLNLRFEAPEMYANAKSAGASPLADFETISNHALVLDGMASSSSAVAQPEKEYPAPAEKAPAPVSPRPSRPASAKVIEFPRFAWAPPTPPPDQLAEPVSERPRILDVPEVEPPAPALGGILIEAVEQPDPEKRLGIDIPLQSAPLGLRLVAALVDGLIIAAAASLFGFIFWKLDAIRPPMVQTLSLAGGLLSMFWAAYQYLLIVYSASTPGLRTAGLELARFDGTSTSRSLRRWRVLASWLSAVSAGMGYVWVFLDEDALCWHDRITHTYLAPRTRQPNSEER